MNELLNGLERLRLLSSVVDVLLPPGRGVSLGAFDGPLPDGGALVSEINSRSIDTIGSGRRDAPLFPTKGEPALTRFRRARHSVLDDQQELARHGRWLLQLANGEATRRGGVGLWSRQLSAPEIRQIRYSSAWVSPRHED